MKVSKLSWVSYILVIWLPLSFIQSCDNEEAASGGQLYDLGTSLESRSISFENPTGAPGEGGTSASKLGVGRKGFPAKGIAPGETVVLCDIEGPGTIRHIWMTGSFNNRPDQLRSMVIRGFWENQEHASIECPLGDFMGSAHGKVNAYQSAVHSTGINSAFNIWLPMPFQESGKITLTNEGPGEVTVYYQVDYTLGDKHPDETGRLHVCFRRENPTMLGRDFELLPERTGKGRFVGAVIGIRSFDPHWWGEGEIKIYKDGDTDFPTICGTGSEDYVCLSYGIQQTPYLYHGCSLDQQGFVSMYRWHLPDPIYWKEECRITIQQIGYDYERGDSTGTPLYEREDDWSSATFWYEPVPSAPLPEFPSLEQRVADLWSDASGE
jgi:hypothetical protein